jgi:hypothetical protein
MGHRHNLFRRVQSNGHLVCSPRKHNGPPHDPIIRNPLRFPLPLRHHQRHLLGAGLRLSNRSVRQKVHRPQERIHPTPTHSNRPRYFNLRYVSRRYFRARKTSGGEKAKLLRPQPHAHVNILANPSVFHHRMRRSFHVHRAAGVLLRAGA